MLFFSDWVASSPAHETLLLTSLGLVDSRPEQTSGQGGDSKLCLLGLGFLWYQGHTETHNPRISLASSVSEVA